VAVKATNKKNKKNLHTVKKKRRERGRGDNLTGLTPTSLQEGRFPSKG
jgi:hypothetical protein